LGKGGSMSTFVSFLEEEGIREEVEAVAIKRVIAWQIAQRHAGTRPRYTLNELLARCDFSIPMSAEDREWLDAPAVGRETGADEMPDTVSR
jgi:hypothetical protein